GMPVASITGRPTAQLSALAKSFSVAPFTATVGMGPIPGDNPTKKPQRFTPGVARIARDREKSRGVQLPSRNACSRGAPSDATNAYAGASFVSFRTFSFILSSSSVCIIGPLIISPVGWPSAIASISKLSVSSQSGPPLKVGLGIRTFTSPVANTTYAWRIKPASPPSVAQRTLSLPGVVSPPFLLLLVPRVPAWPPVVTVGLSSPQFTPGRIEAVANRGLSAD